jgi:hypothetical protein
VNTARTNKHIKKEEEKASKRLMAETTKRCPGCKRSIEKSFGCDHMTCELISFVSFNSFLVSGAVLGYSVNAVDRFEVQT